MQRRHPYHPILGGAGLVLAGAHSAPEWAPMTLLLQVIAVTVIGGPAETTVNDALAPDREGPVRRTKLQVVVPGSDSDPDFAPASARRRDA
jgi:hypothetical protein